MITLIKNLLHNIIMLPPTSQLPPIKFIQSFSLAKLQSCVDYLRVIYNPPVRGSLRRRDETKSPSKARGTEELQSLHADEFERDYAMRWLIALISRYGTEDSFTAMEDIAGRDCLLRSAASLLATCAGTASAGIISRTFVFETYPTRQDINGDQNPPSSVTVELMDVPLDNHDYGSVGAQTWGSACIMADMIAENPSAFGIPDKFSAKSEHFRASTSFRCLELGAGTGLVSLTIGKIILHQINSRSPESLSTSLDIEIITTDYYPSVLKNLERNIRTNFSACIDSNTPLQMQSQYLNWSLFSISDGHSDPPVFQVPFDVIFGADIIYETQHALWVKGCLSKLLRKPMVEDEDPTFHLIIPLRRTHVVESDTIEQVFKMQEKGQNQIPDSRREFNELVITHKENIFCDSEKGSSEEVEYVYYRIGWG